jgi:hypothetical protein
MQRIHGAISQETASFKFFNVLKIFLMTNVLEKQFTFIKYHCMLTAAEISIDSRSLRIVLVLIAGREAEHDNSTSTTRTCVSNIGRVFPS